MQVRLLGPVDVVVDGQPRLIGGRRRTGLLAVLAAGEVVSAEWLSEAVWGGESPPRDNTLHSHISALRRVLGKDAIVAHPPGYVLNLGADGTDVQSAERLLRQGAAAAEPAQAVADLRAALALWRGEPLTGVAGLPGLSGQPGRLEGAAGADPARPGRGPAGRRRAPPAHRRAGADGHRRSAGRAAARPADAGPVPGRAAG